MSIRLRIRIPTYPSALSTHKLPSEFIINDPSFTSSSTILALKQYIEKQTHITIQQQLLYTSYPPPGKLIDFDNNTTLTAANIKSGDIILVKLNDNYNANKSSSSTHSSSSSSLTPLLIKRIPDDNSCLFHSIYYNLYHSINNNIIREYRELIATVIQSNDKQYEEIIKNNDNKSVQEYCKWILSNQSWGGALECSILSDILSIQINCIDIENQICYKYGEEKNYQKCIYLLYSGIHYDSLYDVDSSNNIMSQFSTSDSIILQRALLTAKEQHSLHAYTNVEKFSLLCSQCKQGLIGAKDAQQHAKETGHNQFIEYTN